MKNTLLALCSVTALFAKDPDQKKLPPVEDHFGYVSIGAGNFWTFWDSSLPLTTLGVGHRSQWGHHGFEASLHGNTFILWFNQVKLDLLYHYYFKPNLDSQVYLGAGMCPGINIAASGYWSSLDVWFSFPPAVAAGYEYRTRRGSIRFIDVRFSTAQNRWEKTPPNWDETHPNVVLSYGFGF